MIEKIKKRKLVLCKDINPFFWSTKCGDLAKVLKMLFWCLKVLTCVSNNCFILFSSEKKLPRYIVSAFVTELENLILILSVRGCTIRATKTEKGFCDVEIVWAKGKFPVTPSQLMTEYLNLRMEMSQTHPQLSTKPNAPLFQLLDGSIVTVADMKERFNLLCNDMKLDMSKYTIYSFRIGGATSLARRGVDHRMIQIAGRWRSDAYALYIRMTAKMLATNQADFLQRDVINRELVFLHQNVPTDKLVRAH